MSLNFCKSSFFRFSNLQDKRFDVLINYLLLCLGALICVLALSIGIEAKKGENLQKLSSSKLERAKLSNQVTFSCLSRWKIITLEKIKTGWVL
jgi:hypothetical protein